MGDQAYPQGLLVVVPVAVGPWLGLWWGWHRGLGWCGHPWLVLSAWYFVLVGIWFRALLSWYWYWGSLRGACTAFWLGVRAFE